MPAGHPPIFASPDDLHDKVEAYFNQFFKDMKQPGEFGEWRPTITGLCLFCGFASRQSFYDYGQKDEYSYTIKRAKARIENVYEQYLTTKTAAGAIFALKNFDWTDKTEIDHTSGGEQIKGFMLNVKPETE